MQELPRIPSVLIRLACADLRWCEEQPGYTIEMGEWHGYDSTKDRCAVCAAGAVLAHTLEAPRTMIYNTPFDHGMSINNAKCFSAINSFRMGFVVSGLRELGLDVSEKWDALCDLDSVADQDAVQYRTSPEKFYSFMEELASKLQALGY